MTLIDKEYNANAESFPSLDLAGHNRNTSCGKWTMSGQGATETPDEWTHLRVYCKRWHCPFCGPKKAVRLKKSIIANSVERGLNKLMTLTLDPSKCTAQESVKHIKESWNKLRTYLKRKYGKTIAFITVLELQKNGYAHLHVLVDSYVNQRWLSESWQAVGGGRIVDIRFVEIHRTTHYLAKYLTKKAFLEQYGKNRRYTTSRGMTMFPKKQSNPRAKWLMLSLTIDSLIHMLGNTAGKTEYDTQGNIRLFTTRSSLLDSNMFLDDFIFVPRLKRGKKTT